ncbi:extracellular solute-binding protein [Atopomonas sediminilitoris]|uniref:extracellular solute-binding protein n=1 Tax=Atopomonas sediminilitoris TaxID=2919919 RepID=UPI001F4E547C|nr:extracellular solute-binding protein [Atopomonas sediminilitoris]MCJ8168022.1 extracellular solute-binding protein [Atopomonas sediminilitoris]
MRRTALFLSLCLASVSSFAAGQHAITLYNEAPKYPAEFKHFDFVNPDAPQGGTLRLAGFGSFDSLNPFISKGVAGDYLNLSYETLTFHSLDEPFTEYGLLAESIEKDPANQWVRFTLRPQARFHDGQAVTAADVQFTFNALLQHGAPAYKAYYADVAAAVIESERVIRFDFKHANNRELPMILGQLPVLPAHWWAERDFSKTSLEAPLGSGPYRVSDVEAGRQLRFSKVNDWWGKDLAVNRGFYNFAHVHVDYYRDNTVALEAFKAGQFDFNLETSSKNWATAYDTPALKDGRLIKEDLENHNPAGMQGFVFNLRRPLFADRRVREALSLLFDFEWTNRQLFYGAYTRTRSYFDNSELAAVGLPDSPQQYLLEPWRKQLPSQVFEAAYQPSKTDASGIIREQRRAAFKLLQEAGWRIEGDQLVNADGQPFVFEFLLAQTDFERVLLPYKRNLKELGIDMQLRRVDVSQYINRLRSRDFDMVVSGFGQSSSPGNEQREYWHSSSADNPGSRNLMGLKDPAVDALVDGLINAETRDNLVNHVRALDRVLQWGHYVVPNWYVNTWRVAYWQPLQRPANPAPLDYALFTWWKNPEATPAAAADKDSK